jgi:hypothetical protein
MTTSILSPDAGSRRPGLASRILALTPLWVLLLLAALSPDFVPAMGAKPPDTFGIPLALVAEIGAMLWMFIGVVVLLNAGSRLLESLALTVFTIPATVVVVVTPVVTYALQNLG